MTYTSRKALDVLLLVNVETVRHMTDSFERYSFKAHAAGGWSLEHIHAQNAEALTTVDQWTAWLRFHRDALDSLPDISDEVRSSLMSRIDAVLASSVTQQSFSAVEADVAAVFSPDSQDDDEEVHAVSNLALLDHRDNAALNNSVFEVKRQAIIRRDRDGSYIPACTRNVFLKYYTEARNQQMHFWSAADRKDYLAAILAAVDPYLEPEENEA